MSQCGAIDASPMANGASMNMARTNGARTHGRCQRGERLRASVQNGHWKTTTFVAGFVAGLRTTSMVAPYVLDGPINSDALEVCVAWILVPELKPGDVVIMGKLSSHKRSKVVELIEAAGAKMRVEMPSRGALAGYA